MTIEAPDSRFSKPRNVRLGCIPPGATRPIWEASGKTGSAARAVRTANAIAVAARIVRDIMGLPRRRWAALPPWGPLDRPIHPAQCQVNAAAIGQQGRCITNYFVDPMKCEPRLAGEHQRVPGREAERAGRIASRGPADAKQAG